MRLWERGHSLPTQTRSRRITASALCQAPACDKTPARTQEDRPGRRAQPSAARLHLKAGKQLPGSRRGEAEHRPVQVLGVPDENSTRHSGKLDTFATCSIAVTALTPQPSGLIQVIHRYSSRARLRNSMDSPRLRASPITVLNCTPALKTASLSSTTWLMLPASAYKR